ADAVLGHPREPRARAAAGVVLPGRRRGGAGRADGARHDHAGAARRAQPLVAGRCPPLPGERGRRRHPRRARAGRLGGAAPPPRHRRAEALEHPLSRLLVICLSEASPERARRWMDAGRLPALSELAATGTAGTTAYDTPCLMTPQLWATISTGRSAGQ